MATTCQVKVAMSTQPAVLLHSTVVLTLLLTLLTGLIAVFQRAQETAITSPLVLMRVQMEITPGILPVALRTGIMAQRVIALAGKTHIAVGTHGSKSSAQLRAAGCSRCNAKFTTNK